MEKTRTIQEEMKVDKNLIGGVLLLVVGIGLLFLNETKYIAPFLIGFSMPTLQRGLQ